MKFRTIITYMKEDKGLNFKRVELNDLLNEDMVDYSEFQEEIINNCPFELPSFNLHLTNLGDSQYELEVHDGDFLNTLYEIKIKLDDVMEVGNKQYKLEAFE